MRQMGPLQRGHLNRRDAQAAQANHDPQVNPTIM
jgi:hypothetical protein